MSQVYSSFNCGVSWLPAAPGWSVGGSAVAAAFARLAAAPSQWRPPPKHCDHLEVPQWRAWRRRGANAGRGKRTVENSRPAWAGNSRNASAQTYSNVAFANQLPSACWEFNLCGGELIYNNILFVYLFVRMSWAGAMDVKLMKLNFRLQTF